ncbi:brix domain-containing protein [Colletotrichum tabaci]|uniref:U3 small nucleolar ribonucleoprotein protein IMP4 n=1 Tax=Colletotrichum tabaci TaxID=1209068 RepID=A0AAV9TC20_9PEZI
MIRKQARQRRDYLYRKAQILKDAETGEKRAQLRSALAAGKPLDPEIARDKTLRKDFQYDQSKPELSAQEEMDLDDEYSMLSGVSEPRVLVTTSRDCSSRLAAFSKEIRLLLPHVFVRTSYDSVELAEVGPRMTMRPFEIRGGTLDSKEGDVEWHLTHYTRTGRKKEYL